MLIARERFERFNAWREANGYSILANARNATAGALRRRNDPAEVQRYPLEFHAYAVVRCRRRRPVGLPRGAAEDARRVGILAAGRGQDREGIEGCLAYHAEMESRRDEIPFEMDGIVAKLDDVPLRDRLGSTGARTKWQYAHKFAPVEATTVLRAIEIQVGVNGRLTPRAHVDPVEVLGVTVRHATLHNEDYVLTLGAAPGDRVFVKRAGDVIPQITGVAKKAEGDPPASWDDDVPESLLQPAASDDGTRRPHGRAGVRAGSWHASARRSPCPPSVRPVARRSSARASTCAAPTSTGADPRSSVAPFTWPGGAASRSTRSARR